MGLDCRSTAASQGSIVFCNTASGRTSGQKLVCKRSTLGPSCLWAHPALHIRFTYVWMCGPRLQFTYPNTHRNQPLLRLPHHPPASHFYPQNPALRQLHPLSRPGWFCHHSRWRFTTIPNTALPACADGLVRGKMQGVSDVSSTRSRATPALTALCDALAHTLLFSLHPHHKHICSSRLFQFILAY